MKNLMKLLIILLIIMSGMVTTLYPAGSGSGNPVTVPRVTNAPKIDGNLDEKTWTTALSFQDFKTISPDYGRPPSQHTIVYVTYDEEYLYFAFRCLDKEPGKIKATLGKRDGTFNDDWVAVAIDTFNNQQGGLVFAANPLGIQGDGRVDATADFDPSFDMVFSSAGKLNKNGYTVEMAIPFKSMRFANKKKIVMSFKAARNIPRTSEEVDYPEYNPKKGAALAQFQKIQFEEITYKRTVEILPAVTAGKQYSHRSGALQVTESPEDISLTGKLGLTSSLVLDAAYNPDFSQIETDAGQIDVNLRYSLYYPEKRPFFMEGMENFNVAANPGDMALGEVVHTRNIVDPGLGVKLSGKLGSKNILTLLYALDEYPDRDNPGSGNAAFSILRFQRLLKDDGYVGAFYTVRDFSARDNHVTGIDGRFRLNRYSVFEYHAFKSFTRQNKEKEINLANAIDHVNGEAMAAIFSYDSRTLELDAGLSYVSPGFRTDSGYLTRTGVLTVPLQINYSFFPRSRLIQRITPFYWARHSLDTVSDMAESYNYLGFSLSAERQTELDFAAIFGSEVFAGQRFRRDAYRVRGRSQIVKQLNFEFTFRKGKFVYYDPEAPFQGKGTQASLGIVIQPTANISSGFYLTYADLFRQANGKKVYDYMIYRNRTTFQFNKYLSLRGIVEYNNFHKRIDANLLAAFTYIPGTVIYLGYGSAYEKVRWNGEDYSPHTSYLQTGKSLFFKASYLWRF
jgi:hypothetical protein